MINKENIKKVASILFDCSLDENKISIINNLREISNIINKYSSFCKFQRKNVLYREISNYITHIINEDDEHLQEVQVYLLFIALRKLIADRKDDSNASTKC